MAIQSGDTIRRTGTQGPAGEGVPTGGTGGTALFKQTGDDFDAVWRAIAQSDVTGLVAALAALAPKSSPALTGEPTAPTADFGASNTQIATTAFVAVAVAAAIDAVLNSAPGALDTLDELAAALGDDANFAATVTNALAGKQPLDSDLTAIAALTTTSFGRGLLELANAAALRTAAELVIGTDVLAYDADLAAIAASSTTSFGRALLTLADAAALRTAVGAASDTATGVVEIATAAELKTGTDTGRVPSAASLAGVVHTYDGTLADDAVLTIPLPATRLGTGMLTFSNSAFSASFAWDTAGTQGVAPIAEASGGAARIDWTTGALNAGDGVDTNLTVSIDSGTLYFSNRLGAAASYSITLFGAQ